MCCISLPVHEVSDTNLLVARLENPGLQLTVYQNKVRNYSPKNAMIIGVPSPSTVRFHDISSARDLFVRLESFFVPAYVEEVFTYSNSAESRMKGVEDDIVPKKLRVDRVGDYNVSLAHSLRELQQVDESYFRLSDGVTRALSDYPASWGFIIFGLSDDQDMKKYSPFAFSHEMPRPDRMYIPTLHFHGEIDAIHRQWSHSPEPSWKHDIYVYGVEDEHLQNSELPLLAAGSVAAMQKPKNVFWCVHQDCLVDIWPDSQAGLVLPRSPFFKKFKIHGRRRNGDIFLSVPPPTPQLGAAPTNCAIS